jgi:hypothetical protein
MCSNDFGEPNKARGPRAANYCAKLLFGKCLSKSWPDYRLSGMKFTVIFISSFRQMPHLATSASVSSSILHSTLCSLRYTFVKSITKMNRLSSDVTSVKKVTAE